MDPVSFIRRTAIVIVGILFIASLLLYLTASKTVKGSQLPSKFYNLHIYALDIKIINSIESKLKKEGYFVQFIKEKGFKEQFDGYWVIQDFPDEEYYKSIPEALKRKGFVAKKLKSEKSGRIAYSVGPIFKNKNEAEKLAGEVTQTGIKFEAKYHYEKVPVILDCLIVNKLKQDVIDKLKKELEFMFKDKITFKLQPSSEN